MIQILEKNKCPECRNNLLNAVKPTGNDIYKHKKYCLICKRYRHRYEYDKAYRKQYTE